MKEPNAPTPNIIEYPIKNLNQITFPIDSRRDPHRLTWHYHMGLNQRNIQVNSKTQLRIIEAQHFPAMLTLNLNPKTLSPSSFIHKTFVNPKKPSISHQFSNFKSPIYCKSNQITERGILFDTGDTFFRYESATGRDLGVLSAALYKQSKGQLRVLDAMCGCGIRSLRYLIESKADFVLANDANQSHRRVILENLAQVERFQGGKKRWVVTHFEANRVLTDCYLQRDYFDYIDIDSFGSDSSFFLRAVFSSLKLDGLVYVTSTDGYSSGGHRPFQ